MRATSRAAIMAFTPSTSLIRRLPSMRFDLELPSQHAASHRVAVLLINLGTPDAPTPRAVRKYLAQFLSDPRVVEIPALAVAVDSAAR